MLLCNVYLKQNHRIILYSLNDIVGKAYFIALHSPVNPNCLCFSIKPPIYNMDTLYFSVLFFFFQHSMFPIQTGFLSIFLSKKDWFSGAACSVVFMLRWFNPWYGHDKICTAVGPLSKTLNPILLQGVCLLLRLIRCLSFWMKTSIKLHVR